MNYPLISEYIDAIESAADNFATLTGLCPVMRADGKPYMSSGNFAVVFKMKDEDTGKLYAVKCFTKEEEQREKSYRLISAELADVRSPYLTTITYLEKELYVYSKNSAETEFPVLLMDWVEGKTMDVFIREHLQDQYTLSLLCYNFCRMAAWLLTQPFAHGDIKPDNILVSDDASIVLVDYDGMYVPGMKGQKARELGSPDYRHPARTEKDFNEHIDDFALASIALSLKLISLDPALLDKYGAADRLLFSASDYADLSKCEVLGVAKKFSDEVELKQLIKLFMEANGKQSISSTSSSLFNSEILSTEVTDGDFADARSDEFGVEYSNDGKRLLKCWYRELKEYTVRRGTKVVCNHAFESCSRLTSITLPSNLTSIGNHAFESCSRLTSITLPSGLTSIGKHAFHSCSSLTSITLPSKLKEIKPNPFICCEVLQIINRSTFFRVENDLLIQGNSVTAAIGSKSSYIIPEYITYIGEAAFCGCSSLTSITFPSGLTSIGRSAFEGCSGLTSITLPSSLKAMDDGAFRGCSGLTSITLPSGLTSIGEWAFLDCFGLTSITLPSGLTSIGRSAFEGCSRLMSITLPSGLTSIGEWAFYDCDGLTSITLPSGLTSIGDHAFYRCWRLTSINLSFGLISIGGSAFSDCSSLTSITLPPGLTSIGDSAFSDCKSLTSITLPFSLTSIGDSAFYNCESLTSITLPPKLKEVKVNPFVGCKLLQIINRSSFFKFENDLLIQGNSVIAAIGNKSSYIIPEYITSIGDNTFYNCSCLTSITLPSGLTSIGDRAFYDCSGLTSITLPSGLTTIGYEAFKGCISLTSIVLPSGLTSIGDSAFWECISLTSITLPFGLTSIGKDAFWDCFSLTSITLPSGLTSIGNSAFYGCSGLKSITFPSSLISIGYNAFLCVIT